MKEQVRQREDELGEERVERQKLEEHLEKMKEDVRIFCNTVLSNSVYV